MATPLNYKLPKPFVLMCTVTPNEKNKLTKPLLIRVGPAESVDEAKKLKADDLRAMANTFGGVLEGEDTTGRSYRLFKAEWSEVTDQL